MLGFEPGDMVVSVRIDIKAGDVVTVTGKRFDMSEIPREGKELEMIEFTKYLETTTQLKEEK